MATTAGQRQAWRDADRERRDAQAAEWARQDQVVTDAAEIADEVLPGEVGEAVSAMLDAMRPFRADDGHLSYAMVSRSSPEVQRLAAAILALRS